MRVILNTVISGNFELSDEAIKLYNSIVNERYPNEGMQNVMYYNIMVHKIKQEDVLYLSRHDPILVEVIETLGDKANTKNSKLIIKEIPEIFELYYEIIEPDFIEEIKYNTDNLVLGLLPDIDTENLSHEELKQEIVDLQRLIVNYRN